MDLWHSLDGMIALRLTSADIGEALAVIQKENIVLFGVSSTDDPLSVTFQMRRRDFRRFRAIANKRCLDYKIIKRNGIYWSVKSLAKRPVLVFGLAFLLVLVCFLPTRIYFFQVEGNENIPANYILEKCSACGITFGASRREVRSEKVKNALLEAIPQLQWAGVNTSGCVATISVRERSDVEKIIPTQGVSSIVASRDGVITQVTVTKGNGVCSVGQAVRAGQVLISGYTDCGIAIRGERAEGEIFALTERKLSVALPTERTEKGEIIRQEKKYSLIIGKKRINFYKDSGILDSSCVKMSKIVQLTLPGGFTLPIYWVAETWEVYSAKNAQQSSEETRAQISDFAEKYIVGQMIAGQILSKQEYFTDEDSLDVEFTCREMIGQVQTEEIITPNG